MYNPPIETIIGEMQMQYEGEILRAVQNIGVNVDKDELIRALQYDREQYDKGYEDGFRRGVGRACGETERNGIANFLGV